MDKRVNGVLLLPVTPFFDFYCMYMYVNMDINLLWCYLQVDVFIGGEQKQYRKQQLMMIPYFRALFRFYGDTEKRTVSIAASHPFLSHLILSSLISYHLYQNLPTDAGQVALIMRAADYLGDVWAVRHFSREYCLKPESLLVVLPFKRQKTMIMDTFRRLEHVLKKFHRGNCCPCDECVDETTCKQMHPLLDTTQQPHLHLACCNNLVHEHCLQTVQSPLCPSCNTPWRSLPCCVCRHHILPNDGSVYTNYRQFVNGLHYRTKCCGADMHPDCFDVFSGPCTICQAEWDSDRRPVLQNKEATEHVFITRSVRKNLQYRREGTHYFFQPD